MTMGFFSEAVPRQGILLFITLLALVYAGELTMTSMGLLEPKKLGNTTQKFTSKKPILERDINTTTPKENQSPALLKLDESQKGPNISFLPTNTTIAAKVKVPANESNTTRPLEQKRTIASNESRLKNTTDHNENKSNVPTNSDCPVRLCRTNIVQTPSSYRERIPYHCAGEKYDKFAHLLFNMTARKRASVESCTWSQRQFPIPNNKSVLVMGNSHTRQVLHALICQYQDDIVEIHRIPEAEEGYGTSYFVRFRNGAIIYGLTNSFLVYHRHWEQHVVRTLFRLPNLNLTQLVDAVVVGFFNRPQNSINTAFYRAMVNLTKDMQDVDFQTQPPPSFQDVIRNFSGPVLYMGMFSGDSRWEKPTVAARETVGQELKAGRHNLAVIDSRAHVGELGECASDTKNGAGICYDRGDNTDGSREAVSMHRCNGEGGGHPDLVSWDLVEQLHVLLN